MSLKIVETVVSEVLTLDVDLLTGAIEDFLAYDPTYGDASDTAP